MSHGKAHLCQSRLSSSKRPQMQFISGKMTTHAEHRVKLGIKKKAKQICQWPPTGSALVIFLRCLQTPVIYIRGSPV